MALPFFQQGSFSNTANMTPDQIERKRAYIAAMMPKFGSAKYVGEGLGQLATGFAVGRQNKRLDAAEGAGRESADKMFERIFGTANSAQSPDMSPLSVLGMQGPGPAITPVDPSNPEAIASDAMTALGKGATPEGIKAGLVARGMPEHIAEGFVMNFQDESGLNPGINETSPLVPGSRGGFGLAQWTGPRRKALEAFAAEKGMPVSDPGVQMDFLMTELQGPEAGAWAKISGAQNAGEAGAAIVNDFLRPAEEHRASRAAEYLGGGGIPASGAAAAPTSAPQIDVNELYMALQNPWLTPEQKGLITSMIGEQQAASDPMRQIELEKAQLELAQMKNPTEQPPEDFTARMFTLNSMGIDPQSEEGKVYIMTGKLAGSEGSGGTEYGLTPQYGTDKDGNLVAIQFAKDGTSIATPLPEGVALSKGIEKLDLGTHFQYVNSITGEKIGDPVSKNLAEAESQKAIGKAEGEATGAAITGLGAAESKATQGIALIDSIINDPALSGITGMIQGNLPPLSQAGTDLNVKIGQVQGKAFLEAFDSLKGGGAISEREGEAATAAIARLDRAQSTEAYQAALAELKGILQTGLDNMRKKAGSPAPSASDLSDDDLKYLEE